MPTLKPGQIIGGHEILGLHGKGGMGEIFRARQLSIGREVALKVLSPELARKDPQFAVKFVEEARGAGRLNHPNIVAVHDVGKVKVADRDEYLHYFSMEFIDGENLRQVLEREGTCPQDLINRTMQGMVEALAYGQLMGMVHRDIKPENIMVTSDGRIKLADFGLAQHGESNDSETERDEKGRVRVMGTPRYMSPEQARGRTLDWRSDQYSLGATLFHLLTGSPAYRRESGRATMKAHVTDPVPDPGDIIRVSPAWRAACMRMMAKDPDERYQTPDELREAVNAAVSGRNLPSSSGERPIRARIRQRQSSQRSRILPLLAAVIVIAVGAGLWVSMGQQEENIGNRTIADHAEDQPSQAVPSIDPNDTDDIDSGDDVAREDPTQRRAQEIIDRLGGDHQQAITVLTNNLTNPYYHEGSVGFQLLSQELEMRRRLLAEERSSQREVVDRRLRQARRLAGHGYFDRANRVISEIDDSIRAHNRQMIEETNVFIRSQAETLAEEYRQQLREADSLTTLEQLRERIQGHGFPSSLEDALSEAREARAGILRQQSQQQQALAASAEIRQRRWNTLQQSLLDARGTPQSAPNIARFISIAESYRNRFDEQDLQDICQNLAQIGRQAQAMSQALHRYIREQQPTIRIVSTGSHHRARIDSLDNDRLWVTILDSGVRIRKNLFDEDVDHLSLVTQAHEHLGEDPDQLNAYCWIWQLDPQRSFRSEALRIASQRLTGENQESVSDNGGDAAIDPQAIDGPPFLQQAVRIDGNQQDMAQWFTGTGISLTAQGLQWLCEENVRLTNLSEDAIPSMLLRHSLSAPLHIRLEVQVHGGSLALIGLRQELRAVRLGFDTRNMRVGGMVSNEAGSIQSNPLPTANNALARPMQLDIRMDEDGHITFQINDNPYQAPQELFSLDPGQPVELVFQALNTNNSSRMSVKEIAITAP